MVRTRPNFLRMTGVQTEVQTGVPTEVQTEVQTAAPLVTEDQQVTEAQKDPPVIKPTKEERKKAKQERKRSEKEKETTDPAFSQRVVTYTTRTEENVSSFQANYSRVSMSGGPRFLDTSSPLTVTGEGSTMHEGGYYVSQVSLTLKLPVSMYKDMLPENDGTPVTLTPAQAALVDNKTFQEGPVALWRRFHEIKKIEFNDEAPVSSDSDDSVWGNEGADDMTKDHTQVKERAETEKKAKAQTERDFFCAGRAALLKSEYKDLHRFAETTLVMDIVHIAKFIQDMYQMDGLWNDHTYRVVVKNELYKIFNALDNGSDTMESRLVGQVYDSHKNHIYSEKTDSKCSEPHCTNCEQGSGGTMENRDLSVTRSKTGHPPASKTFETLPCISCHSVIKSDEVPYYLTQLHKFCGDHVVGPFTTLDDILYRLGLTFTRTNEPWRKKDLPGTFDHAIRECVLDPLPPVLFEDIEGNMLVGHSFLPLAEKLVQASTTPFHEERVSKNTFIIMCTKVSGEVTCVVATWTGSEFSFCMYTKRANPEDPKGASIVDSHEITQVRGGVQCMLCMDKVTCIPSSYYKADKPRVEQFVEEFHNSYRLARVIVIADKTRDFSWVALGELTHHLTDKIRLTERVEHPSHGENGRPLHEGYNIQDTIDGSDGGSGWSSDEGGGMDESDDGEDGDDEPADEEDDKPDEYCTRYDSDEEISDDDGKIISDDDAIPRSGDDDDGEEGPSPGESSDGDEDEGSSSEESSDYDD
ncbi:hypothetical protein T484DRAFT_1750528 [Baffinella frigidus]|nr:hypothetical protein T484DRAFT_1750528 [Cryptophyta sp. CCMP2293]